MAMGTQIRQVNTSLQYNAVVSAVETPDVVASLSHSYSSNSQKNYRGESYTSGIKFACDAYTELILEEDVSGLTVNISDITDWFNYVPFGGAGDGTAAIQYISFLFIEHRGSRDDSSVGDVLKFKPSGISDTDGPFGLLDSPIGSGILVYPGASIAWMFREPHTASTTLAEFENTTSTYTDNVVWFTIGGLK